MQKNILRIGFLTAVTVGFFAALPYVSNANIAKAGNAPRSCPNGNCKELSDRWNKKLNCPAPRTGGMSGKVFARDQKKNAFPGCADKVKVKVKCDTCYEVTLKGTWDYNCDTPRSNEHQITDVLFQMPNAYNGNKTKKFGYFTFNDGPVRNKLMGLNKAKIGKDVYTKPDPNHNYTFYWFSNKEEDIDMYIKEYPCRSGACKKYGHQNYLDNSGKIEYTIREVDAANCKVCPNPTDENSN